MPKYSSNEISKLSASGYGRPSYFGLGTADGRTIRRAAERKRRIEAKKLAKSQSSKA